MKTLFIHIGLHKTGTGHLQSIFNANREEVEKSGLSYFHKSPFRNQVVKPLLGANLRRAEEAARYFFDHARSSRILASDENILGAVHTFSGDGLPYPKLGENISKLLPLAGNGGQVVFLLSVRSYADWIESVYLQTLKGRRIESSDDFLKQVNLEQISWHRTVLDLKHVSPQSPILVWSYEAYRENCFPVLESLERELKISFLHKEGIYNNPSYSELAQQALLASEGLYSSAEDLMKMQRFLKLNFSVAEGYKKPLLFSSVERKKLDRRYEEDCAKIRSLSAAQVIWLGSDLETGSEQRSGRLGSGFLDVPKNFLRRIIK